jgi:ribosome-binding factor A
MTQRTRRLDELLRQEIGELLAREVADPRVGFVTVTEVETAPDLRHARVWVSIIGDSTEREATLEALQRAMGFVRRELGHRLRLKRIPELHVRLDDSAERGTRVLRLISELEAGHEVDDLVDETLPTPVPRIGKDGDATEPVEADAAVPPPETGRRGKSGSTRSRSGSRGSGTGAHRRGGRR